MKLCFQSLLVGLALLLVGCPPERPDVSNTSFEPEEVAAGGVEPVAVINGDVLTKAEFERRINALSPIARSRFASTEARKTFLDSQVQFEILADIAEERGYGQRSSVIHVMKQTMVRQMLAEDLRKRVSPADITTEDLKTYYQEHKTDFQKPAQLRVAGIMSDVEDVSRRIHEELTNALSSVDGEQRINSFRLTAQRHGVAPAISKEGGDLGWVQDPDHPANQNTGRNKTLAERAFALEGVGSISEPFEIDGIWYIAMPMDRRPSQTKTFEEVKEQLRDRVYKDLQQEVREQMLQEYAKNARVERNEDILDSIEKPDPIDHDFVPSLFEINAPVRDLKPAQKKETPTNPTP